MTTQSLDIRFAPGGYEHEHGLYLLVNGLQHSDHVRLSELELDLVKMSVFLAYAYAYQNVVVFSKVPNKLSLAVVLK